MIIPQDSTSQTWVIDQIGEQLASVEIDATSAINIPIWLFPKDIHEGDVLRVTRDQQNDRSVVTIVKDPEERLRRLARSREQVTTVSKNDRPGNIIL